MSYIGEKIVSKTYGEGIITAFDNKTGKATIQFKDITKMFMFPQALKSEIQIKEDLKNKIIEQLNSSTKKEAIEYYPNQNFYYVFQGKEFASESRSGIIWAPYGNKHYWQRLKYLKKGDIILHGCNGYICAISQVLGTWYEAPAPTKHDTPDYENMLGRQVNCCYAIINHCVKTSFYITEILLYNDKTNYPPFNKNGTGLQGYLFNIHKDLAKLFINESIKKNPYLLNIDFIKDLKNKNII